jgi:hypothetical protein
LNAEPKNIETFETKREYNNKFPSRIFICFSCKNFTASPYFCKECGAQANGLFKDTNKTYKYIIKEESEELNEIFIPIELQDK